MANADNIAVFVFVADSDRFSSLSESAEEEAGERTGVATERCDGAEDNESVRTTFSLPLLLELVSVERESSDF